MQAYQCINCEYQSIKQEYYCPKCRSQEFDSTIVPDIGKVYSYTTIHTPPPEFADLAPYQVVLVEMTDNLKVTGLMKDRVEIGNSVEFQQVRDKAFVFELAK